MVSEIDLFQSLREKLGDTEARDLIEFMRDTRREIKEDVRLDKSVFATREDLVREIANLRTEIEKGFKEQLKWLIVLLFGFASLIITVIKFL